MNALSVAAAVRMGGGRIRPLRVLCAAGVGSCMAALARRFALEHLYRACFWLPAAAVMMAIACGREMPRRPLRRAGLLLSAYGLLGGTVLALHGATGSLPIAYALGALGMTAAAVCSLRARRAALDIRRARVICRFQGRTASFDAMVDTGNTLRDYLTHLPVIVIAEERARSALAMEGVRMRPIFASTAGGRQRMDVFSPQEITLELQGRRFFVRAVAALAPGMGKDAPALVPASLLEEQH